MQDRVFFAALGGLLHDIGKLIQRSQPDPWKKPERFRTDALKTHAAFSADFIWENLPENWREAVLPAAYHHNPQAAQADQALSQLIALADKLSAGERSSVDEEAQKKYPMQLVSIFDRVSLDEKRKLQAAHYLPLKALALEENTLFAAAPQTESLQRNGYKQLAELIKEEAKYAQESLSGSRQAYLEHLLSSLQRCAWSVPSAYYYSLPDVSLYDHSRMTAALAACLADWDPTLITSQLDAVTRNFKDKKENPVLDQPAALLVGGDISGIQDFIYTLSAQRAAKTLRGRSFYLQLLTEAVLRYVLNALGMPYTNVIYSGGGHFYLLAPVSALEKLPELRRDVTTRLLEHHGTSLYLALEAVSVPFTGFKVGQFPTHWDAMHRKLAAAKQRRYSELGDDFYQKIFEPQAHGGNQEKTCGVCGVERDDVHEIKDEDTPNASTRMNICNLCASFYDELGKKLPNAPYVILGIGQPKETHSGSALDALAAFGLSLEFANGNMQRLKDADYAMIWALNDPQPAQPWPRLQNLPAARGLRYTVNRVPVDQQGDAVAFDELQKRSNGIKRLGVLRMDVDGLGKVFKNGFGEGEQSIASLARVSTLSFQLSLFFEGWIKQICEQVSGDIYAVYAGGDDVFLIAPWDQVPGLALRIIEDFGKYTGGNPDLHISGGMAFIHGKYPIHQAAQDAGRALDDGAKRVDGKNAFHFLGENWKWPQFKELTEKQKLLVEVSDPKNSQQAPRALLQVLQGLASQEQKRREERSNDKRVWGPWMWIGDYQLTRMIERSSGELKEKLKHIHQQARGDLYAGILQWGKAARWAQIYLRKESKDSKE